VIDLLYNLPTYSSTGHQTLWQITALLGLWSLVKIHALVFAFLRDPPATGEHFWADRRYVEMRGLTHLRPSPRAPTVIMRAAKGNQIRISDRRDHVVIYGPLELENQSKRNAPSSPDSQT
jgi:hypothetical protein